MAPTYIRGFEHTDSCWRRSFGLCRWRSGLCAESAQESPGRRPGQAMEGT